MSGKVLLLIPILLTGCVSVGFDPNKPLKIDATVTVRVERELEEYFNDLDAASRAVEIEKPSEGSEGLQ